MSTQPEALSMADMLDDEAIRPWGTPKLFKAAAELRRLHDHTQMLDNAYRAACEVIRQQETVNGELLAALISFTKSDYIKKQHPKRYAAAVAAIAKAEGEGK